ncbi:5-methyltetrahydropteroyltriglutamate--homocysteine S-methyltransferase [Sediminivirga luteola]|uniref:5-methyltetrahydropteroyltriglutamate--homocysteine methyltransferase n=1 Tax=Sediminivirga luteola TaxID=1774748 RepID=A0A8J2XKM3_9MICO|nr:5-methyltetrahydropteroyltriglutamate--homocysteine S-methyltransferase [Sediminivirga luteola]GGA11235.1 5-methyltetrahydropteroyltriglutamate--homocysteine methyltransferase [Sediminivirga luteola]
MTTTPFPAATILGYPRIGPRRELKRAVEAYWSGAIPAEELEATAASLRIDGYARLAELGLGAQDWSIPASFSYYDQVLDTLAAAGAVPDRFTGLGPDLDLDGYFTLARGDAEHQPLEMTKWFDTNYHYLVPEIGPETAFSAQPARLLEQVRQAKEAGFAARPALIGPVTFLALSKPAAGSPADFHPLDRLEDLLPVYRELLRALSAEGAAWVQLDESALAADHPQRDDAALAALAQDAYQRLSQGSGEDVPGIFVATAYGRLEAALPALLGTGIGALSLDLVKGARQLERLRGLDLGGTRIAAGVVDGHNVWRTDLDRALETLSGLRDTLGADVTVATSTSLLHVPYTLDVEDDLPAEVVPWLAFAEEKVREVTALSGALRAGRASQAQAFDAAASALQARHDSPLRRREDVRRRTEALGEQDYRRTPAGQRRAAQRERLGLPALPTTTIGSYPQTKEVRRARADYAAGTLDRAGYEARMQEEIRSVIALQTELGLDVLVHGEPERNDMVQYFAEHLDGFAVTRFGWVQSYGSRCTRPPILFGDVARPEPITVPWARYAQSLTDKPVKGMLTGPVTILAWSFVRDDQPLETSATHIALALRDEVADLETAGIGIVQVDEPALRELLPLRRADQPAYLDWSVRAFRVATAGAADATQIHTHLCYSEFGEVIGAIDGLDADVTSIEAARSRMEILEDISASGFTRGIGPGVYDIHSPRVPSAEEIAELLGAALAHVPAEALWVNPDCGLKTRGYAEVTEALANLRQATERVRATL